MKAPTYAQIGRALAEGIIILVGVLVALALDRWVAGQDSASLQEQLATMSWRLDFALSVLDRAEGRSADPSAPDQFLTSLETVAWYTPWSPTRSTWDELVATGNLDLIRDSGSRQRLFAYCSLLDVVSLVEADFEDQFARFEVPAWSLIPPRLRLRVFPGVDIVGSSRVGADPTEADVPQVTERLTSDPTFYGAFVSLIQNLQAAKSHYTGASAAVREALHGVRGGAS